MTPVFQIMARKGRRTEEGKNDALSSRMAHSYYIYAYERRIELACFRQAIKLAPKLQLQRDNSLSPITRNIAGIVATNITVKPAPPLYVDLPQLSLRTGHETAEEKEGPTKRLRRRLDTARLDPTHHAPPTNSTKRLRDLQQQHLLTWPADLLQSTPLLHLHRTLVTLPRRSDAAPWANGGRGSLDSSVLPSCSFPAIATLATLATWSKHNADRLLTMPAVIGRRRHVPLTEVVSGAPPSRHSLVGRLHLPAPDRNSQRSSTPLFSSHNLTHFCRPCPLDILDRALDLHQISLSPASLLTLIPHTAGPRHPRASHRHLSKER